METFASGALKKAVCLWLVDVDHFELGNYCPFQVFPDCFLSCDIADVLPQTIPKGSIGPDAILKEIRSWDSTRER
jgi:hypothetical protein